MPIAHTHDIRAQPGARRCGRKCRQMYPAVEPPGRVIAEKEGVEAELLGEPAASKWRAGSTLVSTGNTWRPKPMRCWYSATEGETDQCGAIAHLAMVYNKGHDKYSICGPATFSRFL
jgi:hypothetical protein